MVNIRELDVEDRPGWQALWADYLEFYGAGPKEQAFFDTAFGRLTSGAAADFRGFVAEENGQLLGLTHYVFHPNLWRPQGVCYLQDLFTAKPARGRGVARALIEAVAEAAQARGAGALYWLTAEDNYAGRMLYDRVARRTGFIKYQRDL